MFQNQSYIICATSRSGTTLLCDLLTDTTVAGRPNSFFRLQSMQSSQAVRLGVDTTHWTSPTAFGQAYVNAAIKEGTAGTGIFGMRLMWDQVENLSQRLAVLHPNLASDLARIEAAFGATTFIHLSREDKVAQAVSRLKAEQSGLWHLHADGSDRERSKPAERPVYNTAEIQNQVADYRQFDLNWRHWFAANHIQPLTITYEALVAAPQATLATILSALGQDPQIATTITPRTKKLANKTSLDWQARFQTEMDKL